jgi:signal transduction histidine kinase
MFRSLRIRLALSHAGVLAVILIVAALAMQVLLQHRLDAGVTRELQDAAHAEAEQLSEGATLQQPPDSEIPSRAAVRLGVFDSAGNLVGDPAEVPDWLRPQDVPVTDATAGGERVRLVTVRFALSDGSPGPTVVAGRSLGPEEALLDHVRTVMFAGGLIAIAFSLIAGWWLAGLAVAPVQRAYQAQESFAADASHELRTPLTFVRSAVEVMAEDDPELGGQALSEIDYLTALTERLLFLARAERQGLALDTFPMDLGEACRSAARRSQTAHGNELAVSGPAELMVLGDRPAVEAALDAVLENVRTHGAGKAEVTWAAGSGEALVAITDHGPGLPQDIDPERTFERFFRADRSRTRETGGSGLGLPLARALLEAQGGSIRLDGTGGGGVTASIRLRLA